MEDKIRLPLQMGKRRLLLDNLKIKTNKEKLETFLIGEEKMHSIAFAKKVLLANEVQSNNSVEGYYDDIEKIKGVVNSSERLKNKSEKDKLRILNLYKGYNYILNKKAINKENLRELYKILSEGLLSQQDLNNMGKYYREDAVYIYYSDNIATPPYECMDFKQVDKYMNELFSFIDSDFNIDCMTDQFIKSQIIHFYFVYIHPYFDINGRTSRTTALWNLLNNDAYPFVIFNRGIQLNKKEYYDVIMDVRKFSNISFFVDYMMKTVLIELQKEHIMQVINEQTNNLTATDYQTLHYLLSMNSILSLCDFAATYNRYNDKKSIDTINKEMINPLLDKHILIPGRTTNKKFNNDECNYTFGFNPKYLDLNPIKSGDLNLQKKIASK